MSDQPEYVEAHVFDRLAADPRIGELSLRVAFRGDAAFVSGTVPTATVRDAVTQVVQAECPDLRVVNEVVVGSYDEPARAEHLS